MKKIRRKKVDSSSETNWSERSACAALGNCRKYVVSTINSILFSSFFSWCVYFFPRRGFPRVIEFCMDSLLVEIKSLTHEWSFFVGCTITLFKHPL